MAEATAPVYRRLAGSLLNVDDTAEEILQFPGMDGATQNFRPETWLLVSFHFVRTGGSAPNYTPRFGQAAAFVNGDINTRFAYSATAVGTPTSEVYTQPIPCRTDANGRLYFQPGFDAGPADNDADYEFWFIKARGT